MMPFENGLFARQFERVPMGLNPGPRKAFRVPHRRWNHGKSSSPRQTDGIAALKSDCASLCSRTAMIHESCRPFRSKFCGFVAPSRFLSKHALLTLALVLALSAAGRQRS
jgi:hypothetical protein